MGDVTSPKIKQIGDILCDVDPRKAIDILVEALWQTLLVEHHADADGILNEIDVIADRLRDRGRAQVFYEP
jgi:hypothetical protein